MVFATESQSELQLTDHHGGRSSMLQSEHAELSSETLHLRICLCLLDEACALYEICHTATFDEYEQVSASEAKPASFRKLG